MQIQRCAKARTALKFMAEDNRFDVIASGSLLGLHYGQDDDDEVDEAESIPVGFERQVVMYSMDFEEFLWAYGYDGNTINYLHSFFVSLLKEPEDINRKFENILREYIVVGGMPEVVPVEVKAGNTSTPSLNRFLELYHPSQAYKLVDGNIGTDGVKITVPHYMAMFL